MCGLVGIITSESVHAHSNNIKKSFTQLLYLDTLRGQDSTGIALINNKGDVSTYKKVLPGYDFITTSRYDEIVKYPTDWDIWIGHNRAATKGKVNIDNAHPFTYGHITGAHNGTLITYNNLCSIETDTDSQAIFAGMAEHGEDETLKKIDGAFALSWYNSKTHTFNLSRNDERPLFFICLDKFKTVIYGSELSMIKYVASRNGLEIGKEFSIKEGTVVMFNNLKDVRKFDVREVELAPKKLYEDYFPGYKSPFPKVSYRSNETESSLKELGLSNNFEIEIDKINIFNKSSNGNIEGHIPNMWIDKDGIPINIYIYNTEIPDLLFEGDIIRVKVKSAFLSGNYIEWRIIGDASKYEIVKLDNGKKKASH